MVNSALVDAAWAAVDDARAESPIPLPRTGLLTGDQALAAAGNVPHWQGHSQEDPSTSVGLLHPGALLAPGAFLTELVLLSSPGARSGDTTVFMGRSLDIPARNETIMAPPTVWMPITSAMEYWRKFLLCMIAISILVFLCVQECVKDQVDRRLIFRHLNEQDDRRKGFLVVFDHVKFSSDGGLKKVPSLIPLSGPGCQRLSMFFVNVAAMVFNTAYILYVNRMILEGCAAYCRGDPLDEWPSEMRTYLTLSSSIGLISVWHAVVVALAELLGLAGVFVFVLHRLGTFLLRKSRQACRFDAYSSLMDIAEALHFLSTFSALKLFGLVHPTLIGRDFQAQMATPLFGKGPESRFLHAIFFVLSRTAAAFIGTLAFAEKLAFVSISLYTPLEVASPGWCLLRRWCIVAMLIAQTMGAIVLDRILKWRILQLISGEDLQFDAEETILRQVYYAKLGQVIWEEYWIKCKTGSRSHRRLSFLVLMLTFDDRDLQYLLLDENYAMKRREMQEFRKLLHDAQSDARPHDLAQLAQ